MRQEGTDPITSVAFYIEVVQVVLLFGMETWVFSEATKKQISGSHTGFLRQVTGKQATRQLDGTWKWEGSKRVLKKAGIQEIHIYIGRCQATVIQWVDLQTISEVCAQEEMVYAGECRIWEPWWRQMTADYQLRATLKETSTDARERRQW